jgi:hypothetical protein
MTLVSDIIRDAYRESNLIAIGTEPSGAQSDEALRLLNRILLAVYGTDSGEELVSVPIGHNNISRPSGYPGADVALDVEWYIPSNTRLVLNLQAPATVYLSPEPDDGDRFAIQDVSNNLSTYNLTVYGNGRKIGGAGSVVFSTSGQNAEYMFRADLGNWIAVTPLTGVDLWPFPQEFDDMFVISLAARLNPRNDTDTTAESVAILKKVTNAFKARYRQHREVGPELALVRTLGVRWYRDSGSPQSNFNSGIPWRPYRW